MENPAMCMVSREQVGSGFGRFFQLFDDGTVSHWLWGALVLAVMAGLSSVATRLKVRVLRRDSTLVASMPILISGDDIVVEHYENETSTSSYSSDNESSELPPPEIVNFRVKGNSCEDDNGSWDSAFMRGKNVVKLWEMPAKSDTTTGYQFSLVSLSPQIVVSASGGGDYVGVRTWDRRMRLDDSVMRAAWRRSPAAVSRIGVGGIMKFYLKNDVSGELTVGDVRKMDVPVTTSLAIGNGDLWRPAGATAIGDDGVAIWFRAVLSNVIP